MAHHTEAHGTTYGASRTRRARLFHSRTIVGTCSIAALALLALSSSAAPGYSIPMSQATAVSGAFSGADTPGAGLARPVITRPADHSTVAAGRQSSQIGFGGTGEPKATLSLEYRKAGAASWKSLDSFTGLIDPDGKWADIARFPAGALTDGLFDFRVTQKSGRHQRTSAPVTLTIKLGAQPAMFTTPREGTFLSNRFWLSFGGIGEPGARISLSYGPNRTPMPLKSGGRVNDDGMWAASTSGLAVPTGVHDIYVTEDAASGHEDKRTIRIISDLYASQLQWNADATTARVRAGGVMRLNGWTNSVQSIGNVDVQLVTQGRRFSLGQVATTATGSSAIFDKKGVPVPTSVPPGMANLVVSEPKNPDNYDTVPVEILPTLPMKLSLTSKNGVQGPTLTGSGQSGASVQFRTADGTWVTDERTHIDDDGSISHFYNYPSRKAEWDWAHLTARQHFPDGTSGPEITVPVTLPAPDISSVTWSDSKVVVKGKTLGDSEAKGTVQVQAADGTWFDAGGANANGSFSLSLDPSRLGDTFKVRLQDDWTKRATPASVAQQTPRPEATPRSAPTPEATTEATTQPTPTATPTATPTDASSTPSPRAG
ncbi:Ig-like domain-containing protein [Streptomyces huasconensis]|uniref:Ig-like domain-containing protein n=1 Tax=Streptomyces huasconensis TaxID=1854574 RepID=UPI0037026685